MHGSFTLSSTVEVYVDPNCFTLSLLSSTHLIALDNVKVVCWLLMGEFLRLILQRGDWD